MIEKDKVWLLLDSIDHAYLSPDGTYNYLALEVVDKVKYLKKQMNETQSVSAHDSYSCTKPKDVESMNCCKTCTSRQPNVGCKYLKIETVYVKD